MKKNIITSAALLGFSFMTSSVIAEARSLVYATDQVQTDAVVKVAVSGSCSGKFELPITHMSYDFYYENDDNPKQVDVDSRSYGMRFKSGSHQLGASSWFSGSTVTETFIKDRSRAISMSFPIPAVNNIRDFLDAAPVGAITCRDGASLGSHFYSNATVFGFKGFNKATITHLNEAGDESKGTFTAKLSISGFIAVHDICTVKNGDIAIPVESYKLSCAPGKPIKVKVSISMKGNSELQI